MKLMVGEVLEVVARVMKILQHYKGSAVINMLDDIYLRCCIYEEPKCGDFFATDTGSKGIPATQPVKKKTANKKPPLETEEDFLALKEKLRSVELEKAKALLDAYTVVQLCAFADYMSIVF